MKLKVYFVLAVFTLCVAIQAAPPPPPSVRVYIFDCGNFNLNDPGRYSLKREEMKTTLMSVACFLVAHPKGTLMWDVGVIPDANLASGMPLTQKLPIGSAYASRSLGSQLSAIGYSPADITYLALSHFHFDHTANANMFAGATWLVRQKERDLMFSDPPDPRATVANFSALKNSKTVIVKDNEHDVFGDGTVVLKSAPGHSPDHQVLFVKMAKTGPVVISGDLYHYPEELKLDRLPAADFNPEQTVASRKVIDAFIKKQRAQFWIQHDYTANAKRKKAPAFYE